MMRVWEKQFLGPEPEFCNRGSAAAALLLFPYEEGVSYGRGTGKAPAAVVEASYFLELYDEVLETEPYRMGIVTLIPSEIPKQHEAMVKAVYEATKALVQEGKFVALLGGDHSITSGYVQALSEHYPSLGVIQLDAHADLRDSYEGSPLSHACVMSRVREITPQTLQLGIRSMSLEEAEKIKRENLSIIPMHRFRTKGFDLKPFLVSLPAHVFVTVDVDSLDWSVIRSTGTPEPGGFSWDEMIGILTQVFSSKNVVGFDVVELAFDETDRNSPFAVAKLIYRMLGLKLLPSM